jgi:hypothetical protein
MSSAPSKTAKKVATKAPVAVAAVASAAPATAVAAPAVAAAPVKERKTKASAVAIEAAPVAAVAAPEAAVAEAAPVATSVSQIDTLIAEVTSLRETASKTLKGLVQLKKAVARELKEASRRRRRQRKTTESTDGSVAPKRASMFTTPVGLKDSLADFLGKPKGTKMTPAEVSRAVTAYIKTHNLKDPAKGHTIHADGPLRKVLGLKEGEELTYRTIQRYLYKLYNLPEKKSATTA